MDNRNTENNDTSENDTGEIKNSNQSDKKWEKMSDTEKDTTAKIITRIVNDDDDAVNSYSLLLYKWYFFLNAGGLIGAIAFLAAKPKSDGLVYLCICLFAVFSFGLIFIIGAVKIEIDRFTKDGFQVLDEFKAFKEDKTTESYLLEKIFKDNYPSWPATLLEWLSIGFFVFGILIGGYYIDKHPKDLCFFGKSECEASSQNEKQSKSIGKKPDE